MKRKILYLGALLCVMSVFVSCEKESEAPHRWAKTYGLSSYMTEEVDIEGEKIGKCKQGAGYVNYVCLSPNLGDMGTSYGAMFRGMFGAMLPQVLKSVTLEKDGNVTADYIGTPNIIFDPMWAFMAPEEKIIEGLIPAGGWVKSPKGFATWSEQGVDKLLLKLNITNILANEGVTDPNMIKMINDILKSEPAAIKAILAGVGFNLNVSDESIKMLLDWVNKGVVLNYKEEGGRVLIYIDKTSFDTLFKMREDDKSDIMVLWDTLAAAEIIPAEAALASAFIYGISQNWEHATAFDLGLDLQLSAN